MTLRIRSATQRLRAPLRARQARARSYRESRYAHQEALLEFSEHLLPGRWHFMRTVRAAKPLKTVFAIVHHESIEPEALHQFSRPLNDSSGIQRYRQSTVYRSNAAPKGDFAASALLLLRNSKVMLVDFAAETVLRWRPQQYSAEYERHRRVFSSFVPSVSFRISADRSLLYEQLATGGQLARASADRTLRCLDELLPNLTRLALEEGVQSTPAAAGPWLESGRQVGGFGDDPGRVSDALKWLGSSAMIPQHNDLHLENIALLHDRPLCIDFDGVGIRPSWQAGLIACLDAIRAHPDIASDIESRLYRFLDDIVVGHPPPNWRQLCAVAWEISRERPLRTSDGHFVAVRDWALRTD